MFSIPIRNASHWLLLSLLLYGIASPAKAQHPNSFLNRHDPPGVHGMLIFGTTQVFASHLPMFHSPHDYQVVLELTLPDSARNAYLGSRQAYPGEPVYTLEPERLVLPNLIRTAHSFRATLYRGHFERGGTPIALNVLVSIRQVVYARPLNEATASSAHQAFLLLGGSEEQFLIHQIEGRPNFDQVLRVRPVDRRSQAHLPQSGALVWQLSGPNTHQPLPTTLAIGFVAGRVLSLKVEQQVYTEFDDLR